MKTKRRIRVIVLVVAVMSPILLLTTASPVQAERDPFRPLVSVGGSGATTNTTTNPATTTTTGGGGALPRTGIDADLWAGGALQLIVVGVVLLGLERFTRLA